MPGFLVPSDLQRLCPPDVDLMTWAKEHLRADEIVVYNPKTGEKWQVLRSLNPAKQANGHCHWLQPDGHCAVHDSSPFGCAFFDTHMKDSEAMNRNRTGEAACREDFAGSGPYSQVWQMLMKEGLTTEGGEAEAAGVEFLKIKAKLAKRAAKRADWQARKQRRKKRKKARRRC